MHLQCIRVPATRDSRGGRAACPVNMAGGGELHLIVAHLVLDRTKETRLFLGGITTFVKDSKNLYHNKQSYKLDIGDIQFTFMTRTDSLVDVE